MPETYTDAQGNAWRIKGPKTSTTWLAIPLKQDGTDDLGYRVGYAQSWKRLAALLDNNERVKQHANL